MNSTASGATKGELNEATARTAGLKLHSQREEIHMKTMAMMAGTLMVIAGCATTDPVQPAANAATANVPIAGSEAREAKVADDLRCEYRPIIGSRVGKKLCYSEEEWALMESRADEVMKYIDDQTRSSPYSEGDP